MPTMNWQSVRRWLKEYKFAHFVFVVLVLFVLIVTPQRSLNANAVKKQSRTDGMLNGQISMTWIRYVHVYVWLCLPHLSVKWIVWLRLLLLFTCLFAQSAHVHMHVCVCVVLYPHFSHQMASKLFWSTRWLLALLTNIRIHKYIHTYTYISVQK